MECIRSVLLEERGLGEVGGISSCSQDDDAIDGASFSIEIVRNSGDLVALFVDGGNFGFLDDLDSFRISLDELFQSLHECICDGHSREFGIVPSVCSGMRMPPVQDQLVYVTIDGVP